MYIQLIIFFEQIINFQQIKCYLLHINNILYV